MAVMDRVVRMFRNAFTVYETNTNRIPSSYSYGSGSSSRPHSPRMRFGNEKTIIASIYTRISIDFASIDIRHIRIDPITGRYAGNVDSGLNRCLTYESNLDQGPRAFRQNIVGTLFDDGVIALVPVNVSVDADTGEVVEIKDIRVGSIKEWFPRHVRVSLYNEKTGTRQEITVEKRKVAIVENPFYAVMNETNSTLQRLIRKLSMLDAVDEQSSSGKLDLIIQLPYTIKSDARRKQAEDRRKDIEFQLKGSQYGIAYSDATEKITQLNRATENQLLKQIEYLVEMLYSELGITKEIMDGTADEKTMINYYTRTIEPLHDATSEAMQRAFLGVKGTENNERIRYIRNPFKLVPLSQLADIANSLSRNEIITANELRDAIGMMPSDDPKADVLNNSNMPQAEPGQQTSVNYSVSSS